MPEALLEHAVYRFLHVHCNYFASPQPLCLSSVVLAVLAVEISRTLLLSNSYPTALLATNGHTPP